MPAPGGRGYLMTDEMVGNLLSMLSFGVPISDAVKVAGISHQTFYNWIDKGKADLANGKDTQYAQFVTDVDKAQSRCIVFHLAKLQEGAAAGLYTISQWVLAHLRPEIYGAKAELNVKQEVAIKAYPPNLSPDVWDEVEAGAGELPEGIKLVEGEVLSSIPVFDDDELA